MATGAKSTGGSSRGHETIAVFKERRWLIVIRRRWQKILIIMRRSLEAI